VTTEAVRPRKAQAPAGKGLRTRPTMVEMKMKSDCHEDGAGDGGMVNLWKKRRGWVGGEV